LLDGAEGEQTQRPAADGEGRKDREAANQAVGGGELYLGKGISRGVLAHLRSGVPHPVDTLTVREREVLQLVAGGMTCRDVGDKLGIAHKTADTHRSNLMRKLDIHNVADLTSFAIRHGFISP
jgi:two-component system, NarL family, response regulator NreC